MSNSLHESRWLREGWGVFLLTLGLVLIICAVVTSAGWTEGLHIVTPVGLGAFAFAFLAARSRLPDPLGPLFSLPVGTALSFRLTADLIPGTDTWPQRWAWMWYRIYLFGKKALSGSSSADNLIFLLQMCLLVWVVIWLIVWFIFRARRVWDAIVLAGLLLLGTLYYAPAELTGYMILFLVVALLLVIRFNLHQQERNWRRARIPYHAGEVIFNFWRIGMLLTLLVVALAWLTPAIPMDARSRALDTLRTGWYDIEERWGRLFTTLHYRSTPSADFSGQELTLGGPRQLGDAPVMEITSLEGIHYWREVALDYYTGRRWINSDEVVVQFGSDYPPLAIARYQAQIPRNHTVTVLQPDMTVLAMAGQPTWVSIPARARVSFIQDQLAEGISYARSRLPLRIGDHYTVATLLGNASIEQLQQSEAIYPEWIRQRYLQLPDTLPERVRFLAETITDRASNAYDKATAVEDYLRHTITYNEQIDPPPAEYDAVDYVLFEKREGYCDYYASAMVVMLRAVGIPARLAAGYAQGEHRVETNTFLVRQKDAHAWPEVFFPEYGWVIFEPTAARPQIERSPASDVVAPPMDSKSPYERQPPPFDRSPDTTQAMEGEGISNTLPIPLLASLLLGAGIVLALLLALVMSRRLSTSVGDKRVEAFYARLGRLASWAGIPLQPWQTPLEQAAAIATAVPNGGAYIWQLAEIVTRIRYAEHPPKDTDLLAAARAWRSLYPCLLRAVLRRQIGRLVGILIERQREEIAFSYEQRLPLRLNK